MTDGRRLSHNDNPGRRIETVGFGPLYNEEELVGALLEKVIAAPLPSGMTMEIIVADDESTDSSVEEVEAVAARHPGAIRLLQTERNQGKGAALRRAIAEAQGDFAIIQDADLEYDPREYPRILAPLIDGRADAVYGSRFMVAGERRVLYFWHSLANHLLTGMCNIFADLNLTDMETCYKAFRTPLLKSIPIRSQRFGFEPEITIKLAKRQARIYETPISYNGRTYEEGKKIGLKDAFNAFWVILTASFSKRHLPRQRQSHSGCVFRRSAFQPLDCGHHQAAPGQIRPRDRRRHRQPDPRFGGEEEEICRHRPRWRTSGAAEGPALRAPAPGNRAARCVAGRGLCSVPRAGGYGCVSECFGAHRRRSRRFDQHLCNASGRGPGHNPGPGRAGLFSSLDEELGHCRRYSEDELRRRMTEAGFAVETVLRFNRISRPGWWRNGKILETPNHRRFQLKTFDRMVWFFRRIDAYLPWSPTSLVAIGRKQALPRAGLSGSGTA